MRIARYLDSTLHFQENLIKTNKSLRSSTWEDVNPKISLYVLLSCLRSLARPLPPVKMTSRTMTWKPRRWAQHKKQLSELTCKYERYVYKVRLVSLVNLMFLLGNDQLWFQNLTFPEIGFAVCQAQGCGTTGRCRDEIQEVGDKKCKIIAQKWPVQEVTGALFATTKTWDFAQVVARLKSEGALLAEAERFAEALQHWEEALLFTDDPCDKAPILEQLGPREKNRFKKKKRKKNETWKMNKHDQNLKTSRQMAQVLLILERPFDAIRSLSKCRHGSPRGLFLGPGLVNKLFSLGREAQLTDSSVFFCRKWSLGQTWSLSHDLKQFGGFTRLRKARKPSSEFQVPSHLLFRTYWTLLHCILTHSFWINFDKERDVKLATSKTPWPVQRLPVAMACWACCCYLGYSQRPKAAAGICWVLQFEAHGILWRSHAGIKLRGLLTG